MEHCRVKGILEMSEGIAPPFRYTAKGTIKKGPWNKKTGTCKIKQVNLP